MDDAEHGVVMITTIVAVVMRVNLAKLGQQGRGR